MGKYTKQVFFCDECKKEFDENLLNHCIFCDKDVCKECSKKTSLLYTEDEEVITRRNLLVCNNCVQDKKKVRKTLYEGFAVVNTEPQNIEFSD